MSPLTRGALIGGGLAGVGAVLWGACAYLSGWEAGLAAVLVGALTGFGMAQGTAWRGTVVTGAVAALMAALAVVIGRFGVAQVMAQQWSTRAVQVSDDDALHVLADKTYERFKQQGRDLMKPDGSYASEVWSVARRQWSIMGEAEKAFMLDDLHTRATDEARAAASVGFITVAKRVHGLNGVFLFMSVGAAFGLGWFDAAKSAAKRKARAEEADIVAGPSSIGGSPLRGFPKEATGPGLAGGAAKAAEPARDARKVA